MATHTPPISAELINILFDWYSDDASSDEYYHFFYECLCINRLFFQEGTKRLWQFVGYCGKATIEDLAKIAERSTQRAQIYANEVQWLVFRDMCGGNVPDVHCVKALSQLKYPKIKAITLNTEKQLELNESTFIAYLQPSLRELEIDGAFLGTSDTLLEILADKCPDLEELSFRCEKYNFTKLDHYLAKASQIQEGGLQQLRIHTANTGWSSKAFKFASDLPELRTLECPNIETEWIRAISIGFPSLWNLQVSTTVETLEMLSTLAPGLKFLTLSELKYSASLPHLFKSVALYQELLWFEVNLHTAKETQDAVINGNDLTLLAQSCGQLETFRVVAQESHPVICDITEELIDTFTRHCPALEGFFWLTDEASSLDFGALRSIGKHCREMSCMRISVKGGSMPSNLGPSAEVLYPELVQLWLVSRGDRQELLTWVKGADNMKKLAGFLGANMPELHSFTFIAGTGLDETLDEATGIELRKLIDEVKA